MRGSRARRWQPRRMLFPSSDGYRVRACAHKIAIGDSDLINVRFGPPYGLKSDISRGPRSCHEPTFSPNGRLWNVRPRASLTSLRFNVGCADNFAPFLRFVGDELAEISRRACNFDAAEPY